LHWSQIILLPSRGSWKTNISVSPTNSYTVWSMCRIHVKELSWNPGHSAVHKVYFHPSQTPLGWNALSSGRLMTFFPNVGKHLRYWRGGDTGPNVYRKPPTLVDISASILAICHTWEEVQIRVLTIGLPRHAKRAKTYSMALVAWDMIFSITAVPKA
jgi:hypothetical protein